MPQKFSSRPQTLRQARRAYQRSAGVVRLTERERRQLERSAELQERASRIRERENKRKANIRKKNERIEREREARQRMGISSPVKETVGASQMRLSKFLEMGTGLKREWESPVLSPQSSGEECRALHNGHAVEKAIQERHPLEPLSHNQVMASPAQISAHTPENHNGVLSAPTKPKATIGRDGRSKRSSSKQPNSSTTVLPQPRPAFNRPSKESTKTTRTLTTNIRPKIAIPRQAKARNVTAPVTQTPAPEPYTSALPAGPMRPPPIPKGSAAAAANPSKINNRPPIENSQSPIPSRLPLSRKPMLPPSNSSCIHRPSYPRTSNDLAARADLPKAQAKQTSDDGWAAFLVSNTQIERELSTPEIMLSAAPATTKVSLQPAYRKHGFTSTRQPMGPPLPPPLKSPKDETAALLAGICTQDLNYGGGFSSDGPELASPNEVRALSEIGEGAQSFGSDDLSDSELEDVARDVEQASSAGTKGVRDHQQKVKETFCEDDFDLSTQELCQLVD